MNFSGIATSYQNKCASGGEPTILMMFNATCNNMSVMRCGQFYWWRKLEYSEKTTDLSQATEELYHIQIFVSEK